MGGEEDGALVQAQDLVQDHSHHHHVRTGVRLVSVGNLAGVLQTVHEGFQFDIATFEGVSEAPLCTLNKEFSQDVDFPLSYLLKSELSCRLISACNPHLTLST